MKKNTVDSARLAQIINDVWDGVERSKVGGIYIHHEDGSIKRHEGTPICSQFAANVFITILAQVIPKEMEIQ